MKMTWVMINGPIWHDAHDPYSLLVDVDNDKICKQTNWSWRRGDAANKPRAAEFI